MGHSLCVCPTVAALPQDSSWSQIRSYAMQQDIMTRGSILAVTDRPTIEQLQVWWEVMQSDDLSVAYAD